MDKHWKEVKNKSEGNEWNDTSWIVDITVSEICSTLHD
jgi:hypothetical protein